MAVRRIMAFFMHEKEEGTAKNRMKNWESTESYVLGDIDEDEIKGLEKEGLIVQVLDEHAEPETPGRSAEVTGLRRMARRPSLSKAVSPVADAKGPNFYIVGLKGPVLEGWRNRLQQLGVKLIERISRNHYTVRLTPELADQLRKEHFVAEVRFYGPEDTGPIVRTLVPPPSPPTGPAPPPSAAPAPTPKEQRFLTFDVLLHRTEDLDTVRKWLQDHRISIAGASGRKVRFYLLEASPLENEIAALSEVAKLEEYIPPKLHNDVARHLMGIDDRAAGQSAPCLISQTGEGQIVGVADTGLDADHPDFQGRVAGVVARGRPNNSSDPHGHGTHVAGSVLGSGAASGGKLRGVAPQAKLFFQSLLDADNGLGGLPLDLGELFGEAYAAGARIHNNSWGAATDSMYTISSVEVDEFVATRRDMLVVISAGNDGDASVCLHTQKGFVDWLSLGSPATAKNALTVGASRSSRRDGAFSAFTYGQAWGGNFPDPPISQETVSGDPEGLAAFSSRGPCDDRRIKPDVVGPGTDIASVKSSKAPLRNFWGPYPGNSQYAFMGGTSMSAPLVSGCAALVREYYAKDRSWEPSAALLRATVINGTRWLKGQDAVAEHGTVPNFHQGFGCVYMPWVLPNGSEPSLMLEFLDTWKNPALQFVRSGQRFRFKVSVGGGKRLRFCLAYTDLPARALQNNLNLFVQELASGRKWMGNEDMPLGLKIPDPDNNVESIRIEDPTPGDYLVQVAATNLLGTPQDFALVVTGELTSALIPF